MKIDKILQDYSHTRVPKDKTKSLFHLCLIVFAAVVTVLAFMLSQAIFSEINLIEGTIGIAIGYTILFSLLSGMAYIGAKTRLTTANIIKITFGTVGGKFFSLLLGLVLLMWFGITVDFFGTALGNILNVSFGISVSLKFVTFISGFFMMISAVVGFKGLDKVSVVFSPLMIGIIIFITYKIFSNTDSVSNLTQSTGSTLTISDVITLVVGGSAAGVVCPPDITRFAKSGKEGVFSYGFCCTMAFVVVFLFAILLKASEQTSYESLVVFLDIGILGIAFLFMATWTSNDNNLYSSSLSIATLFEKIPKWKVATVLGFLGIVLGMSQIFKYFMPILNIIGIIFVPIAAIIITDFFLIDGRKYLDDGYKINKINIIASISWLIPVFIIVFINTPLCENFYYSLTTIPALDSFILSFIIYIILHSVSKLIKQKRLAKLKGV